MIKITKKKILIILIIFIGGCQQCILENQLHPKIGFTPQAITLDTDDYFSMDIFIDEFESIIKVIKKKHVKINPCQSAEAFETMSLIEKIYQYAEK